MFMFSLFIHSLTCFIPSAILDSLPAHVLEPWMDETPGAHVSVFFLTPDELRCMLVLGDFFVDVVDREWAERFDPDDGCVLDVFRHPLGVQVVVVLATAKNDALHVLGVGKWIGQNIFEMSSRNEVLVGRGGLAHPQHCLRGHDNERLSEVSENLAAHSVEILSWRCRENDVHVNVVSIGGRFF